MIDVSLFRTLRFSRGERRGDRGVLRAVRLHLPGDAVLPVRPRLGPLSTGVRILPVAITIAVGSVVGVRSRPGSAPARSSSPACCCSASRSAGSPLSTDVTATTDRRRRWCCIGPRPGPDHRAGDRVDPERPAGGEGRRRLGRQRRDPGGRRHPGRRRARQHLHLAVRRPHRRRRVRRAAGAGPAGRAGLGRRRDRRGGAGHRIGPDRPDGRAAGLVHVRLPRGGFVAAGICWAGALGALALPGRIRTAAPARRPVEAALS